MTLFDRVFSGNDAVYGLTEAAIDNAIAQYGADQAVSFPHTAYSLPCYYAVTGTKVANLGELKEALGVVKTLMTREQKLNDAFMSGCYCTLRRVHRGSEIHQWCRTVCRAVLRTSGRCHYP